MQRKSYRYSVCFKQSVVRSIEEDGLSISQARERFGIKGSETIQKWLKQFGKYHLLNKVIHVSTVEERDELSRLKKELRELKIAYAELAIDHKISQKVIEVTDEMFGTDLKKKYEEELSRHSIKKNSR